MEVNEIEYEENSETRRIYKTYADTEVASLYVNVECPYCGNEFQTLDTTDCGEMYTVECDEDFEDGCGKTFEMYFDAS